MLEGVLISPKELCEIVPLEHPPKVCSTSKTLNAQTSCPAVPDKDHLYISK